MKNRDEDRFVFIPVQDFAQYFYKISAFTPPLRQYVSNTQSMTYSLSIRR